MEGRCHVGAMRRNIKKSFWVNLEEDFEIKEKARAACLTEAELFRQLVKGYHPATQPDDRFWKAMDLMREMADKVDRLAMKTDTPADMVVVMNEAKRWRMFQNAIEKEYLRPKRGED